MQSRLCRSLFCCTKSYSLPLPNENMHQMLTVCVCSHATNLRTFVETFQGSLRNGVNGGCDFRFLSGAPMLLFLSIAFSSVFSTITRTSFVCAPAIGVILSVSFAYVRPYKSLYMNLSMSFHFGVLGLVAGVFTLWYAEVEFVDTQFLASAITMLAILPHLVALIMILVWILHRIRCLREAVKKMLKGILKFLGEISKALQNPSLTD